MTPKDNQSDALGMNVSFDKIGEDLVSDFDIGDGFNEYGVREHDDGSIDVLFRAMEPGTRDNGEHSFEVSTSFLKRTAGYDYDRIPVQEDHDRTQNKNVGWTPGDRVWFRNGAVYLMPHIPNTGSQRRSDVIADFTNDPPAIRDGSIQFDPRTVDFKFDKNDNPKFTDGRILEFSLTPFPAGYDDGGLSPAFSQKLESVASDAGREGRSRLNTSSRPYTINKL